MENIRCGNKNSVLSHPLWIKFKSTVELAKDFFFFKIIKDLEYYLMMCGGFYSGYYSYPYVSTDVMFDPLLLLNVENFNKIVNFV